MIPTWAAVVTAVSLAIIALAALVVAVSAALTARGLATAFRALERLAGPAIADVRALVQNIRGEADALVGASRDIRLRIVRAADAAQARLSDVAALFDVMREELDDAALDAAATVRRVRTGIAAASLGRRILGRRRRRKGGR